MIQRLKKLGREEALRLRVVEKAQRKSIEVYNLHMNAKVGPIGSC